MLPLAGMFRGVFLLGLLLWYSVNVFKTMDTYFRDEFKKYLAKDQVDRKQMQSANTLKPESTSNNPIYTSIQEEYNQEHKNDHKYYEKGQTLSYDSSDKSYRQVQGQIKKEKHEEASVKNYGCENTETNKIPETNTHEYMDHDSFSILDEDTCPAA